MTLAWTVFLLLAEPTSPRVETALFELSVGEIHGCGEGRAWMGVAVRARAKADELFLTPRDFTLERGGVIVASRHVGPPTLPRCLPLLPAKQLRAKESVRGFVLFEVPAAFRGGDVPVVLAYRPTRWGGARRVELPLPSCLDTCPDVKTATKKTAAR
jgi:hypothetical protein